MIALSLAEIAAVVGGQTHDIPDPSVMVTGPVVRDSREAVPGSLFAAFVGERVDGHDYARAVVEAGAAAVLGSRPVGVPAIVVDDVPRALGALAQHVVQRLGATLVALTGSAGKTSTKDLIAQVLRTKAPTVFTPGSLNNEIGLPLTALSATAETRFLVLEMGARGIGHIRYLTELTPPRIGLVLNVGSAHIGEFGGREQIAQAKGELVESLPCGRGGRRRRPQRRRPLREGHGRPHHGTRTAVRGERRSGRTRRERDAHGHRTALVQPSHTLRVQRCDDAPVR